MSHDDFIDMKFEIMSMIMNVIDCPCSYEEIEHELDCLLKVYINR